VRAFLDRLRHFGRDWRSLGKLRIAAIGPKTALALREQYLEPDLVPTRFQSEDLAAALKEKIQPGARVLLARADRGRELLRDELAAHTHVEQIAVYSQVDAVAADVEVLDSFRRGEIDYVLLTSSNIARALVAMLDADCRAHLESQRTKLISISAVTSAAIRELGLPVAGEAVQATQEGVIEALLKMSSAQVC
jgi:uroporphyrinogen III methyltransferase / synthase